MKIDRLDHLVLTVGEIERTCGRIGATGPIRSVYLRDPDGNLGSASV